MYDKKMFLIDELYKDNLEYKKIDSKNYIDKFLFYRSQDDDIDIDVCEINIDNYKLLNPLISLDAKKTEQKTYNKSNKKFELYDNGITYRGDTLINCMQVLLQIVNYDSKGKLITSKNIDEIKEGLKKSSVLNDNPEIRSLLNKFVEKCYSEGNFFAIPFINGFSLNQAKGRLKSEGYNNPLVDSSDTYFKVCYDYFNKGKCSCQLTNLIDKNYDIWKNKYSNNWNLFIEHNCFCDFINNDGTVKKLWNKTDDGFTSDLKNYLNDAIIALTNREERIINFKDSITL